MLTKQRRWYFILLLLFMTACTGIRVAPVPTFQVTLTPLGSISSPVPSLSSPTPFSSLPTIAPTTGDQPGLQIVQLKMFDMNTGWALHDDYLSGDLSDGKILRTENGIQTWKNVSPSIPEGYKPVPKVAFIDPDTAIAVYIKYLLPTNPQTEITIRRTKDGGQTWQASDTILLDQAPLMGIAQIFMLDQTKGWMLGVSDGSMGTSSLVFFETQDGGMHWNAVYNTNDHIQENDSNTLWSFFNYPYGSNRLFIFNTGLNGYFSNGNFFHSTDGGKSWLVQELPTPKDKPELDARALRNELRSSSSSPQFVSTLDGVIVERFYPLDNVDNLTGYYTGLPKAQYLFFTHDGGKTWNSFPSPARIGDINLQNAKTGWFLGKDDADPSTLTQLFQTLDGAKTWIKVSENCSLPLGSEMQFVDSQTGFANSPFGLGTFYGKIDSRSGNSSVIFTTSDGGETWNPVTPHMLP